MLQLIDEAVGRLPKQEQDQGDGLGWDLSERPCYILDLSMASYEPTDDWERGRYYPRFQTAAESVANAALTSASSTC